MANTKFSEHLIAYLDLRDEHKAGELFRNDKWKADKKAEMDIHLQAINEIINRFDRWEKEARKI